MSKLVALLPEGRMELRGSSGGVSRPYCVIMAERREEVVRRGRPGVPLAPRVRASWDMAGWDFRA